MNALFDQKRIFLVGGPGGVGKTTLAAALGVQLAQAGYRTVVLTVDPARRLAQALGFETFPKDLHEIPIPGAKGALFASMLDTERYFDRVIEKFATSAAQREKVLGNPLYRTMVESLGGSHEYAAMERLLEFAKAPAFDKIVVDTPPSDNARELFEAPQRLADFMDGSVLKWFQGGGKLYTQFFRTGTRLAMGALKLVFGGEFLDSLGTFLADLEGMQAGFRNRNLEVIATLQSPTTGFLLVTVPSEARAQDCEQFQATLRDKQIPLARLVLNRLEPEAPPVSHDPFKRIVDYQSALHAQQTKWKDVIRGFSKVDTVLIPRRIGALQDVSTLSELGRLLVQ